MRMLRRTFASLLLCLLTIPAIVQTVTATAGADLPECCRRDGKHHCAMDSTSAQADGPSLSAFQQKCPLFPRASTAASSAPSVLYVPSPGAIAPQTVTSALHESSQAAATAFFGSSVLKRGPPSLSC
jgi:hypothetical protein